MRIVCFGLGYCAAALAARLAPQGWSVATSARDPAKAARLRALGYEILPPPEAVTAADLLGAAGRLDALLVSAPPVVSPAGDGACPALAPAADALAAARPGWIGYLSSTAVYGDWGGAWVDEDTTPQPSSRRAQARLAVEQAWRDFAQAQGLTAQIFRLSGIYGPGRSAIDRLRAGDAWIVDAPDAVFCRVHVADVARWLAAALAATQAGVDLAPIYNLSDDVPASPADPVRYAAALMGVAPPSPIPLDHPSLSAMARSFYADSKRVANARAKRDLGAPLLHPSYREGMAGIWAELTASVT